MRRQWLKVTHNQILFSYQTIPLSLRGVISITVFTAILFFLSFLQPAGGRLVLSQERSRPGNESVRILAGDATINAQFGSSLAFDDDTLVVGAPGARDSEGISRGAVYVYVKAGTSWIQQSKLLHPESPFESGFGGDVAISRDTIIVTGGQAVYVFIRQGEVWSFQAKLLPEAGNGGAGFGSSIAIDEDTVAVGASGAIIDTIDRGAAYVFKRSGDSWSRIAKLTDPATSPGGDQFGGSISVDEGTIVVGSPFGKINSVVYGIVCVFVQKGESWQLQARFKGLDTAGNDRFATDVVIENDRLLIGADNHAPTGSVRRGAAYIFERLNGSWTEKQKLTTPAPFLGEDFGGSVDMSNDRLVIGDRRVQVDGSGSQGAAFVFVRNGETWSFQNKLGIAASSLSDFFGTDVSIVGSSIFVGGPGFDTPDMANQGAVYFFIQSPRPPDLIALVDSGFSNSDNITNISDLIFDVDGVTPGATVELIRNGTVVATQTAVKSRVTMSDSPPSNATYQYASREVIGSETSSLSESVSVTIDKLPPPVWIEQGPNQIDPTVQTYCLFRLYYNEGIVGFETSDISFEGSTANLANVVVTHSNTPVSDSLRLDNVVGDNQILRANIPAGSVSDLAGNPNIFVSNVDNSVLIDNVRPTLVLNQSSTQADPTNVLPLRYSAVFSEPVTGFTNTDIVVTSQGGNVTGNTVTVTGSGAIYEIAVSNLNLNGFPVRVTTSVNSAQDALGNFALAPTSTDNFVTLDNVGPTISLGPAPGQANPSSSTTINFQVTFNEAVTTFDSSDISLSNSSADVSSATVQVTGSGTTYNVAVSNFISNGQSLSVRVVAGAVADPSGNQSLQSQIVSVLADNTGPSVTVEQAPGQIDPTALQPINFRVTFSETVSGFAASDVSLAGSTADTSVARVAIAGGGTTFNIAVSNVISSGVLMLSIPVGSVTDSIGNANAASTSVDNAVSLQIPATANIAGRVTDLSGRGQAMVRIEAVLPNGERYYAQTNPFGFYRFVGMPTGQIRLIVTKKNRGPAESVFYLLADAANSNFTIL